MTSRADYQKAYRKTYRAQAKRVGLTFDLAEFGRFERQAAKAGKPVAAFVKDMAKQGLAGQGELSAEAQERLAELDRVVRGIATNVNQMARHSNRLNRVLDEQEVFLAMQKVLVALEDAVADLEQERVV